MRQTVASYVARLDPALVSSTQASAMLAEVVAAKNMLGTAEALLARRVAEGGSWRTEGHRSAAHQLARRSGLAVSKAKETLDSAARLESLPAVEAAARGGELSAAQLAPLSEAAAANPNAATRLLELARSASVAELADECARTKAAAHPDDGSRHRAIHAARFLRRRRTADGAGEITYRSTPEEVAQAFAFIQGWGDRAFKLAWSEGRKEPAEAYLADGLLAALRASVGGAVEAEPPGPFDDEADEPVVATTEVQEPIGTEPPTSSEAGAGDGRAGLFDGDVPEDNNPAGSRPRSTTDPPATASPAPSRRRRRATAKGSNRPPAPAKVIVRIDFDALVRGFPAEGEVCEITGLGPVPVAAVRAMVDSGNAVLAAVVTKGTAVARVVHLRRNPTAFQRTALEWFNPTCTRLGCNNTVRLQIDHRQDWATSRITVLELLDQLCGHDHDLKTYKGWALVEGTGKRLMVAPDDPRHPDHAGANAEPETDEERCVLV